jgi:hypothetical protein
MGQLLKAQVNVAFLLSLPVNGIHQLNKCDTIKLQCGKLRFGRSTQSSKESLIMCLPSICGCGRKI